jgi:hypothetical protein
VRPDPAMQLVVGKTHLRRIGRRGAPRWRRGGTTGRSRGVGTGGGESVRGRFRGEIRERSSRFTGARTMLGLERHCIAAASGVARGALATRCGGRTRANARLARWRHVSSFGRMVENGRATRRNFFFFRS